MSVQKSGKALRHDAAENRQWLLDAAAAVDVRPLMEVMIRAGRAAGTPGTR